MQRLRSEGCDERRAMLHCTIDLCQQSVLERVDVAISRKIAKHPL